MDIKTQFSFSLKTIAIMLILSQSLLQSAFGWPWDQPVAPKTKSSTVEAVAPSATPVMTQTKSEIQGTVPRNSSKESKLSVMRPADNRNVSNGSVAPQPQSAVQPTTAMSALKEKVDLQSSYTINAPQRNANYEKAVKLQSTLNDLLKLSTDMDRLNRSKVIAVQGMVDKARINQNILTMLASPGDVTAKLQKSDAEQILLTKKLRGMREEAEKQISLAQANKSSVNPNAQKTIQV